MKAKVSSKPAITITRNAIKADKLVYVAQANKAIRYKYGESRIVYIGTTKAGARRIAQSAASKAEELLRLYGVRTLQFYTVTSTKIPGLKSWRLLERALILRFRERFGEPPKSNIIGKRMKWNDELEYLTHKKLDDIINHHC